MRQDVELPGCSADIGIFPKLQCRDFTCHFDRASRSYILAKKKRQVSETSKLSPRFAAGIGGASFEVLLFDLRLRGNCLPAPSNMEPEKGQSANYCVWLTGFYEVPVFGEGASSDE